METPENTALDYCSSWSARYAQALINDTRQLAAETKNDFVKGVLAVQECLAGQTLPLPPQLNDAASLLRQSRQAGEMMETLRAARRQAASFTPANDFEKGAAAAVEALGSRLMAVIKAEAEARPSNEDGATRARPGWQSALVAAASYPPAGLLAHLLGTIMVSRALWRSVLGEESPLPGVPIPIGFPGHAPFQPTVGQAEEMKSHRR